MVNLALAPGQHPPSPTPTGPPGLRPRRPTLLGPVSREVTPLLDRMYRPRSEMLPTKYRNVHPCSEAALPDRIPRGVLLQVHPTLNTADLGLVSSTRVFSGLRIDIIPRPSLPDSLPK